MAINENQDSVIAPRRTLNSLIPICCLALVLFLLAITIVVSLIPVYIGARNVERRVAGSAEFDLSFVLRNGRLPVGQLSAENCAALQAELSRQAASSKNVRTSVPTLTSCEGVTSAPSGRKRRRRQDLVLTNTIILHVILSGGNCITDACSISRAYTFIALLLGLGDITINLAQADGSRFDFICYFTGSPVVTVVTISTGTVTTTTTTTTSSPLSPNISYLSIVGVNGQNQLLFYYYEITNLTFDYALNITGTVGGDIIKNIDYRPGTGEVYGASDNRLYAISDLTGVARPIGDPLNSTYGNILSLEMDPVIDYLVYQTASGRKPVVNPQSGKIFYVYQPNGTTGISMGATNNLAGATTSQMYFLNATAGSLFVGSISGNDTIVTQVGSGFGININDSIGFDISPDGQAIACLQVNNNLILYSVNLNSGTLSQIGVVSEPLLSLAIKTVSVAYGIISSNNSLLYINDFLYGTTSFTSKKLTGLQANETIVAMDMRPYNGEIFALSSAGRIYGIDTGVGQVYQNIPSPPITPLLNGTAFGMDFNPINGLIRIVSDTGQNLRINPDTGAVVAVDTSISPGALHITAIAYSDNVANATNTTLYAFDTNSSRLYIENSPNSGILTEVGSLNITAGDSNGIDFGLSNNIIYAVLTVNGVTRLGGIFLIRSGSNGVAIDTSFDFSRSNNILPVPIRAFTVGLNV